MVELEVTIKIPTAVKEYQQPTGLFINNEFVKSQKGRTFEVINPATEEVICSVYEATEKDVDIAVSAARKAFCGEWRKTDSGKRGDLLYKLASLIEENSLLLASIESLNNGKSISSAKGDVAAAVGCLKYYAGWADKIHGKVIDTFHDKVNYVKYEPIGVCGQIIPWNFPLLMWVWKIGPAIATGNTVVLKTAEQTPLSALVASRLVKEAGFPPGVINILSGFGKVAGRAISHHMGIDKVAFTGSTAVGREIMRAAGNSNLKKVTLELGGKSPNVVFDDADIDQAIHWVHLGIFFNHGQCCCAGSRIYVQEGIYDEFVERFKDSTKNIAIGDPFDERTFQGPQVSQVQFDRIMGYIEHGKNEGAKIECGGERLGNKGYYIQPTIISNVHPKMKIMQEEIFGPVASISKFKTIEEVIELANDTTYGLAAGVHTKNIKTAHEFIGAVRAGSVWVNQYNAFYHSLPFGGFQESGIGRELGKAALSNYTQAKAVSINLA